MKIPNHNNPWLGWSSYNEDSIKHGHLFVGRTNEISKLFTLIDNNLLVTIYGKSGIGKTSLLRAGVFPSLLAAGYMPIICRCGSDKDNELDNSSDKWNGAEWRYITGIISEISKKCRIVPNNTEVDVNKITNLVELFEQCSFRVDSHDVYPTLVFDQFEDWARLKNKNNDDSAISLLQDLSFLISDDYPHTTNFRFILSIREDYLYLIEDMIDSIASTELKLNRYRLTHLNREQANEIFELGTLTETVKNRLLEISKDGTGYTPGLISFYCHELYEISNGNITDNNLALLKDVTGLIGYFYNSCFKTEGVSLPNDEAKISLSTKNYIEEHLQENGVRRPLIITQVKKHIPENELNSLLEGRNKLLQKFPVGDNEYIELIHDKIAEIIYQEKISRLEESKKIEEAKKVAEIEAQKEAKNRLSISALILYFTTSGFFLWSLLSDMKSIFEEYFINEYANNLLQIKIVASILLILSVLIIPFNICGYIFNSKKLKYLIISIGMAIVSYIAYNYNIFSI